MSLEARELTPADVEALGDLFQANDTRETRRQFSPFALDRAVARRLLESPHLDRFFGGWNEGRLMAFGMLRGWDEGYAVPSFGLLLDAAARGRGLSQAMVAFGLGLARRLGCNEVRATVNASNLPSLRMLERAGYRERSRVPVVVDGEPDEKLVMLCLLSDHA